MVRAEHAYQLMIRDCTRNEEMLSELGTISGNQRYQPDDAGRVARGLTDMAQSFQWQTHGIARWRRHALPLLVWLAAVGASGWFFAHRSARFEAMGHRERRSTIHCRPGHRAGSIVACSSV